MSFVQLSIGLWLFYSVFPGQWPESATGEPVSGRNLRHRAKKSDRFHLGLFF